MTKSFAENDATAQLAGSFFVLGYDRCSIDQMLEATDTSKSSLYNRFGSKRGAFQQAIEHYRVHILQSALFCTRTKTPALDQIDAIYQAGIDLFTTEGCRGCLLLSRIGRSSNPAAIEAISISKAALVEELADHLRKLGFVKGDGSPARLMVAHLAALANWADDGVGRELLVMHATMFAEAVSQVLSPQREQKPLLDYDFMVARLSKKSRAIVRATSFKNTLGWQAEAFLERLYQQDCQSLQ